MARPCSLVAAIILLLPVPLGAAETAQLSGVQLVSAPFEILTDVGSSTAEEELTAEKFMRPVLDTAHFFLQVYDLKSSCFDEYATYHDTPKAHFEKLIRIHIWRSYDSFLADYQKRYVSKSIPGAFFGINALTDGYGRSTSTWIREIGCSTEGNDDETVLRELYHEMGHLFMRTYIVLPVEIPSWIEEGTAELFQYRIGNGTHPEMERDQRTGWLREMLEDRTIIPWKEMTNVHNLDNLEFTYQDPIRSVLQYVQAWSMMEFMVSNDQRQNAFLQMLHEFKSRANNRAVELQGQVSSDEAFLHSLQPYLYDIQDETFAKCYGNQLLEVEAIWRSWIQHEYELELPLKPQLHYYRGDWYLLRARLPRKGDTPADFIDKASTIFEDCIRDEPNSPYGYVGRGRVLLLKGKLAEAGDTFTQALRLDPANYEALLYGGIALVMSGRCPDAVAPLTAAVAQRPTDSQAQLYLGQALAACAGDITAVVQHLRLARDLDPKLAPQCCFLEGGAQYLAGHFHDAYLAFLRADHLEPTMPDIPLFEALADADEDRDHALTLLRPLAESEDSKALTEILQDAKRPLPSLHFTTDGWPQIDFSPTAKPPGSEQLTPATDSNLPATDARQPPANHPGAGSASGDPGAGAGTAGGAGAGAGNGQKPVDTSTGQ